MSRFRRGRRTSSSSGWPRSSSRFARRCTRHGRRRGSIRSRRSAMSEAVLSARGIVKTYRSGERRIEVLRGLDLGVAPGEAIAVVGDSGVGKSTLLHILGGLDLPDAGSVAFRGEETVTPRGGDLAEYRNREVGFIFQFHHLLPEFTALENVEMPFRIGRRSG